MAQIVNYPLPPLFLTPILEAAKKDHTHVCDEWCAEDDGTKYCGASACREGQADNAALLDVPTIVGIVEGRGRHVCDSECPANCLRSCEDSDWVVEVCYSRNGWHAIYGVKYDGGDVPQISLWAD